MQRLRPSGLPWRCPHPYLVGMKTTDGQRAVNLRISGRVQGVGYRAWMSSRALTLGLDGWVRNRWDGSVEALVCGKPDAVEHLITACHAGPSHARVTEVKAAPAAPPDHPGFDQLPTV